VSVGQRCTCSFDRSPGYFIMCGGAILARKASGRVVLTKHSRVSFHRSLHHCMPRKLKTQILLFSDLSARFLDQTFHLLYCGTQTPFFGHFGNVQGQAHVGLFQLYTTFLPCHSSRHVEHLREICCCFKQ